MSAESCGACKFFKRHIAKSAPITEGFCKRYPPSVLMVPQQTSKGIVPVPGAIGPNMNERDWCGEFKLKVTLQ